MTQRDLFDWLTLALAVVGAVLGFVSSWRLWVNDRPRVRVRCSHAMTLAGDPGFTVNVVNLSAFPITVTQVSCRLLGTDQHLQLLHPIFTGGERLPVRLEPRAACTVVQPLAAFHNEALARLWSVCVSTACGLTIESPRGIFLQLNKAAAAAK